MVLRKSGRVGSRRFRKRRDSVPKGIGSFFVYKLSVVIVKTLRRNFGSTDIPSCYHFIYAYILANLNMKNFTSETPLNKLRKALILALKDSAEAFVSRSSK